MLCLVIFRSWRLRKREFPQFFLPHPTPPAECWEKCSLRRASQLAPLRLASSAAKARFYAAYLDGPLLSSWHHACLSIFSRRLCWAGWFRDAAKAWEDVAQWLTTANFSI